jgi:hypothetical protein
MRLSVVGFKFKTDVPYMNAGEMQEFRRLLDGGRLTFYDTALCAACSKKVIKGKTHCSKLCFDHDEEGHEAMKELEALVDREVELETVDSNRRHGTLTKVEWGHVEVNEKRTPFPREIILDGDTTGPIPWTQIKWIREV